MTPIFPRKRRKPRGIAAVLLPFDPEGRISERAFVHSLRRTKKAGLWSAINMDTGFGPFLDRPTRTRILRLSAQTLGRGTPFVAGAFDDPSGPYLRDVEEIRNLGGTPILFPSNRLGLLTTKKRLEVLRTAARRSGGCLAFELGKAFGVQGGLFDPDLLRGVMETPEILGLKHSSLDPALELDRLALRDRLRPGFRIYTGNDLCIRMIEHGSDYLLGLAAFCPEKFAERDRLWVRGDPSYFDLAEALQVLGAVAFRPPVPAYKHSAAIFLRMTGHLPGASERTHPRSPKRTQEDRLFLRLAAQRLQLL